RSFSPCDEKAGPAKGNTVAFCCGLQVPSNNNSKQKREAVPPVPVLVRLMGLLFRASGLELAHSARSRPATKKPALQKATLLPFAAGFKSPRSGKTTKKGRNKSCLFLWCG
ncbi:MAG: hypothetical protein II191_00160, partial [Clostridia bacterium]|nr:hypothetical protein [Clostridia bacterium]